MPERRDPPPRAPSCDLVPALSFLPSTTPGHRVELGTQHHPAIDRVTPRTPHASHTWVRRGTSRGSQMAVLETEPAKERGRKPQDLGTRGSHHFAVPPRQGFGNAPWHPGSPLRAALPAGLVPGPGVPEHSAAAAVPVQVSAVKDPYKAPPSSTAAPTITSSCCPRLLAPSPFLANLNNLLSSAVPLLFQLIRAFRERWLLPNPTNPPLTSFHAENWLLLLTPIPISNGFHLQEDSTPHP